MPINYRHAEWMESNLGPCDSGAALDGSCRALTTSSCMYIYYVENSTTGLCIAQLVGVLHIPCRRFDSC